MRPSQPTLDVTVVIPTRDRLDFLAEAIESVLVQTRAVDRLVVVDNSQKIPAEVEELCAAFGEGRVEYLPPLRDLSLNENHQRALSVASSTFVCVLQDDDRYAPTFIERAVSALADCEDASLYAVNYAAMDPDGVQFQQRAFGNFPAGILSPSEFIAHAVEYNSPVHLSASMFRRDASCSAAFYEGDSMVSDLGLFMRIACAGPVILVDEPLSSVRIHGGTASSGRGWSVGSRSLLNDLVPLEWAAKERFLKTTPAARVLGESLPGIRSKGAKRVTAAYRQLIRDRNSSLRERMFGLSKMLEVTYRTWQDNRVV